MEEFDPGPILDRTQNRGQDLAEAMEIDSLDEDDRPSTCDKLLISVDFGTTFSCVAYTRLRKGVRPGELTMSQIKCINRFKDYKPKGEMAQVREDVPTELWYNYDLENQATLEDDTVVGEDHRPRKSAYWKNDYPSSDEDEPERPREVRSRQKAQEEQSKSAPPRCWGFGVQNQLKMMDIPKHGQGRISRFKLLLDNSDNTKNIRRELQTVVKALKKAGLIQDMNDLYTHYLTHLLENAKEQLDERGELYDHPAIEFILCVPAKWPIKGSRVLQSAMARAVKEAGFGKQGQDGVSNLFLVTEPEAAAACVLAENRNEIFFGEVILILDAGGGTVDAATYKVTSEEPFRMDAEVVEPDSELCGATYINERFEQRLLEILRDEKYLITNGKTLESIVESLSIIFENGDKRSINTEDLHSELDPIYVDNLREDRRKGLRQNRLLLTREDMRLIFRHSLFGTKRLLKRQLELAEGKEKMVEKIILTGGFGQSPSLRDFLRDVLKKYNNEKGADIGRLIPRSPCTAVAKGAILRALKKSQGPKRTIRCSYGFLRDELYEPDKYPEHKKARPKVDAADGELYVIDTIDWLITAGTVVDNREEISIGVKHTFALDSEKLECIEELYVSESRHQSHYKKGNANNKGAELAGSIIADMTFLRDEGRIQPEGRSEPGEDGEEPAKLHWAVRFDLVMIVQGRNLRYQARWPSKEHLHPGQQQTIQVQDQVCIAAAFDPGTA